MTCLDRGQLQTLIDNELAPEDRSQMQQHLKECESCQTLLAEMKIGLALLGETIEAREPIDVPEADSLLPRGYMIRPTRSRGWWSRLFGAKALPWSVATASIAVAVTVIVMNQARNSWPIVLEIDPQVLAPQMYNAGSNDDWHSRRLVITIKNEDGEVEEVIVTEKSESPKPGVLELDSIDIM